MCVIILFVENFGLSSILTLLIQVVIGIFVYVGLSVAFKLKAFQNALRTDKSTA